MVGDQVECRDNMVQFGKDNDNGLVCQYGVLSVLARCCGRGEMRLVTMKNQRNG